MILNIRNIKKLKKEGTPLTGVACDYIIRNWDNYDDKKKIFLNITNNSWADGVENLIRYSDSTEFYENYKLDISKILYEVLDNRGINSPADLFGKQWDKTDPLVIWENNQNLLARFGFEETIRRIANDCGIEL